MTKPKPKDQLQKRGRSSLLREEYILIAKAAARFGAIEEEIADELNIGITTLERWKEKYPEFRGALKVGKQAADDRVERSLYQRANGYCCECLLL
jgi:transposase